MKCDDCGGVVNGDNTCVGCGLIYGRVIVPSRPYLNGELGNTQHLSYPTQNLGSDFDFINNNYNKLRRLRRLNGRRSWKHRKLARPLMNLAKLCSWLELPNSVRDEVSYLYRKCQKCGIIDYRLYTCAIVFIVCRRRGIPRTEEEVLEFFKYLQQTKEARGKFVGSSRGRRSERQLLRKAFRRTVRRIVEEQKIKLPTPKPEQYLPRFAHRLGLDHIKIMRAYKILWEINSPHPAVMTAVAIYEVSGKTTEQVAEACGIASSSISKHRHRAG